MTEPWADTFGWDPYLYIHSGGEESLDTGEKKEQGYYEKDCIKQNKAVGSYNVQNKKK